MTGRDGTGGGPFFADAERRIGAARKRRSIMRSFASFARRALRAGIVAGVVFAPAALAQEHYPSRPIDFIVPWGPGGGADQVGVM